MQSMEAETRYADSDGVSIAYQVHGEGPLDLVFVPGFVSHVELYWDDPATARFLRRLTSFARVVIWDKREQGLSDRTGRPPTLILQRRGDRIARVGQGRCLAEAIPGAKYVELEGDDHLPIAGDQDALLDEVEEFLVGSRRGSEPERALATVLFTDIVGSTERAAELGDRAWRELLERHDTAVRRQLELHRGREVKTMGEGL